MEQINPSKFADLIGVQRSSVSHILSGRNKPSFDFLEKTLKAFPGLKADWLVLGKGKMYEQTGQPVSGDLFPQGTLFGNVGRANVSAEKPGPPIKSSPVQAGTELGAGHESGVHSGEVRSAGTDLDRNEKKVVQVMILFDDNTFTSYRPSQ
jgi:hypothetical protein